MASSLFPAVSTGALRDLTAEITGLPRKGPKKTPLVRRGFTFIILLNYSAMTSKSTSISFPWPKSILAL